MKHLLLTIVAAASFTIARSQDIGASNALNNPLNNYDSYSWTEDIDEIPTEKLFVGANGVYLYNNNSTRRMIKDAIAYELDAKGYDHHYYGNDVLVQFLVTEQPGEIYTVDGYQVVGLGLDTIRTEDNFDRVNVDAGTLLINITDAKTHEMLWQGYASGILKADMVNSQEDVRKAVSGIFDKFDYEGKDENE